MRGEREWVPYSLERTNASDDADFVLETGRARRGLEVRLDGLESGERPLAEFVLGRHGASGLRSGRCLGGERDRAVERRGGRGGRACWTGSSGTVRGRVGRWPEFARRVLARVTSAEAPSTRPSTRLASVQPPPAVARTVPPLSPRPPCVLARRTFSPRPHAGAPRDLFDAAAHASIVALPHSRTVYDCIPKRILVGLLSLFDRSIDKR